MAHPSQFAAPVSHDLTVTIASGAAQSGAVDLNGHSLVGVLLPATLDGTSLTFQTSSAIGGTYVDVHDGGSGSLTKTVAASKHVYLDPMPFLGVRFLKLTMGTNQSTTDTVITLVTRPIR